MEVGNMSIGGIAYKKVGLNGNTSDSLMTLLDFIDDFNRSTNYDELLVEIGKATQSIMNAEASSLMLLDDEQNNFSVVCSTGPVKEEIKGRKLPSDKGFCGWVAEHKLPLIANDIDTKNELFGGELSNNFTTRNLICAPLLDNDKNVMGVIEAINRYDRPKLEEQDIPVFQALANHAATAIKRSQDEKKQADRFQEQNMYLTEIHHRVKNDLALISGIVEVESLDIEDEQAKQILKSIQSRIKSMAVVYELLSGEGSNNKAEVGTYFKKLVNGISASLQQKNTEIDIQITTESVVIDPYKALSCGLILNELLLNTYKHAFDGRDTGLISVELRKDNNEVIIDYRDNGQGLPENFNIQEQDSLGFKMIHALVKQLDGTLELHNNEGAHFMIRFKTSEKKSDKAAPALKRN